MCSCPRNLFTQQVVEEKQNIESRGEKWTSRGRLHLSIFVLGAMTAELVGHVLYRVDDIDPGSATQRTRRTGYKPDTRWGVTISPVHV